MPKRLKFVVEQWVLFMVYDGKRGRRGDSKFSNRPVTFEWNRIWTSDSNSNRIWKLRRPLSNSYIRCLWACIFSGHWDIGDVMDRNGPKFEFFFELLAHPLESLSQSGWLYARMCAGLCPTYATALDPADENRNGRRLSCSRRNSQNWYYVTQFLAHPVEPRERLVHTDATVG